MDNSMLYDNPIMVRKFLQENFIITDEKFTVAKFEARMGEHFLIRVDKNESTDFLGYTAILKHSYISVNNHDYLKWRKIYLRKYKLIKIKNNVKIY